MESDCRLVCRCRVESGDLKGVQPEDLVSFYLKGRADSTYAAYDKAFRTLMEHAKERNNSVFCWGEGEVIDFLVKRCKKGVTEAEVKSSMAVVNMLCEAMGRKSPTESPLVGKVRAGVLKERKVNVKRKNLNFISPQVQPDQKEEDGGGDGRRKGLSPWPWTFPQHRLLLLICVK